MRLLQNLMMTYELLRAFYWVFRLVSGFCVILLRGSNYYTELVFAQCASQVSTYIEYGLETCCPLNHSKKKKKKLPEPDDRFLKLDDE